MGSKSNWCVITGGPSSGKKTVLKLLKEMGYPVVKEVARGVIDRANRRGISTEELRRNEVIFQLRLLPIKAELERRLPRQKRLIMNRGMPDSIAYLENCSGDPKEALALCERDLYRKVFLLDQLSQFTPDYARTEDIRIALRIHWLLRRAYEQLGYEVIAVPEMSPIPQLSIAKRLALILTHVYEGEVR